MFFTSLDFSFFVKKFAVIFYSSEFHDTIIKLVKLLHWRTHVKHEWCFRNQGVRETVSLLQRCKNGMQGDL